MISRAGYLSFRGHPSPRRGLRVVDTAVTIAGGLRSTIDCDAYGVGETAVVPAVVMNCWVRFGRAMKEHRVASPGTGTPVEPLTERRLHLVALDGGRCRRTVRAGVEGVPRGKGSVDSARYETNAFDSANHLLVVAYYRTRALTLSPLRRSR